MQLAAHGGAGGLHDAHPRNGGGDLTLFGCDSETALHPHGSPEFLHRGPETACERDVIEALEQPSDHRRNEPAGAAIGLA